MQTTFPGWLNDPFVAQFFPLIISNWIMVARWRTSDDRGGVGSSLGDVGRLEFPNHALCIKLQCRAFAVCCWNTCRHHKFWTGLKLKWDLMRGSFKVFWIDLLKHHAVVSFVQQCSRCLNNPQSPWKTDQNLKACLRDKWHHSKKLSWVIHSKPQVLHAMGQHLRTMIVHCMCCICFVKDNGLVWAHKQCNATMCIALP